MHNPFLSPSIGFSGIIGKACMASFDAAIMNYSFYEGTGLSCHLGIANKNLFTDDESAFICMAIRNERTDGGHDRLDFTEYIQLSTEEGFIEDAEKIMVPIYGHAEIKEVPAEKFIGEYDGWIDNLTTWRQVEESGKVLYKYNDRGIYRNGEEYSGTYQLFHPLMGQHIEKAFMILDEWNRKEYFAISNRYYFFLNQEFHSL